MIVFDSSTLILLAKAELLDVFLHNYKNAIIVSQGVEKECSHKKTFDAMLIQKRIEEGKIVVKEIKNSAATETLSKDFRLNIGEAETLSLALQEKASLVATDDKNAINACKLLRIPFTSAIGILLVLYEKSLLKKEDAKFKLEKLIRHGRYAERIARDTMNMLEAVK